MDFTVLGIFVFVYIGMALGRFPGLALDRSGVALLGGIALLATGRLALEDAWRSMDVPTLALLFGLMVVSAQFRLGGFYTAVTRRLAQARVRPETLLGLVIAVSGGLAAVLSNDIVCLAMAPILLEGAARRRLDPMPFLLGLACASNVGSAATLIGNPQVMLIGQALDLSFARYLLDGGAPAILGLAATWWILCRLTRGRWELETEVPAVEAPPFNPWQTTKGLVVLTLIVIGLLFGSWPAEVVALAGAGVLLMSRKMATRQMIGLVDWHLLVLFMGLFVVNHAFEKSGMLGRALEASRAAGLDVAHPSILYVATVVLSNIVSNVPAVMLLLPAAKHPLAGPILALSSTLAGNVFLVGSIANLIVAEQAGRLGVTITWRRHLRVGLPVSAATLAIAAGWLWLRAVVV